MPEAGENMKVLSTLEEKKLQTSALQTTVIYWQVMDLKQRLNAEKTKLKTNT